VRRAHGEVADVLVTQSCARPTRVGMFAPPEVPRKASRAECEGCAKVEQTARPWSSRKAKFAEWAQCEIRRIYLLSTRVNRG